MGHETVGREMGSERDVAADRKAETQDGERGMARWAAVRSMDWDRWFAVGH